MSLFNTIAHDGTPSARGVFARGGVVIAIGLALAIAVGFSMADGGAAEKSPARTWSAASGLAHDEFLRLNTTALDALVPAAPAVTGPQGVVDRFTYLNTTALDALVPAASAVTGSQGVVDRFIYLNTTALEYPPLRYSEQPSGPR